MQLTNEHLGVRLIADVDYDFDRLLLRDFVPRKISHNLGRLSPNSVWVRKFNPFVISHRAFTVDDVEEVSGHASPFVSIEGPKPLFSKIVPGGTSSNIEANRRQTVWRSCPTPKMKKKGPPERTLPHQREASSSRALESPASKSQQAQAQAVPIPAPKTHLPPERVPQNSGGVYVASERELL
jgi:hypothetical protein